MISRLCHIFAEKELESKLYDALSLSPVLFLVLINLTGENELTSVAGKLLNMARRRSKRSYTNNQPSEKTRLIGQPDQRSNEGT